MSWDRLADVGLGPYNVKLPAVAFTLAAAASVPLWRRIAPMFGRGGSRSMLVVAVIVAAMVALLIVRSLVLPSPASGLSQVLAVLTGAVFPAGATLVVVRSELDLRWALNWVIAGGYLACAFGLYQLVAFYSHLPQFIDYTGVGTGGGIGRIAAFSYEPAYFAYFLVIVAGALIAKAVLTGSRVPWYAILVVGILFYLANVRALLFLLPVAAVLLATSWRMNRRVIIRSVAFAVVLVAGTYVAPVAVTAATNLVAAATAPSAPGPAPGPVQVASPRPHTTTGHKDHPTRGPSPTATPKPVPAQVDSPANVLNPNEQSSNAPRLALYRAVLKVDLANPVVGVGPGQLRRALDGVGYHAPNQGSQVVANNVWLQAIADGGVVLLALELGLIVTLLIGLFRFRRTPAQPLIAAWLAVIFVGGMLTSYFFDLKVWVALGLIGVAVCIARRGESVQPRAAAE